MNRHFNTHLEGLDLQFWHGLIESRGKLISLKKGEYLCRKELPTNICGYVKSGYFIYTVDGVNKIGGFAFPEALVGDYPSCMHNAPAMFDIAAGKPSEVWVMDGSFSITFEPIPDAVNSIDFHESSSNDGWSIEGIALKH